MKNVYILWEHSGCYEDRYTGIKKIYTSEEKAISERDSLNKELKDKRIEWQELIANNSCTCDWGKDDEFDEDFKDCDFCEAYSELYRYEDQWDYTVECKEVED